MTSIFKLGPLQTQWLEELESGKHRQSHEYLSTPEGMS